MYVDITVLFECLLTHSCCVCLSQCLLSGYKWWRGANCWTQRVTSPCCVSATIISFVWLQVMTERELLDTACDVTVLCLQQSYLLSGYTWWRNANCWTQRVTSPCCVSATIISFVWLQVMTERELLDTACEQFLGKSVNHIRTVILQTLEGHLRAILGMWRQKGQLLCIP